MGVDIARLSVLFTSDASQLEKGVSKSLKNTGQQFAKWGKMVGTAGAGAAAALAGVVKSAATAADSLAKTSRKLGTTTDELAGLRHAAEQTGVASNTLDMGLQRMTRRIAEAAAGTGEAKNALIELGLSADALNRAGPAEAMRQIAEAMKNVENQGDRVRLAMKLFDSEGVALVNTLGLGADGLREMQTEAERLGLSFDEVDARRFEEMNDSLDVMRKQFVGLRNTLAVELLPVVELVKDVFGDMTLAERFSAFADGWRSAVATATGYIFDFSASFLDMVADLGEGAADLIRRFPKVVDAVAASVEAVVNTVIDSINLMIKGAVAGINALNAAVSTIPGVSIGALGSPQIGEFKIPDNRKLAALADGFAAAHRAEAEATRALARDSFAAADEFALAMNSTIDTAKEAAAAGREFTAISVEEIDRMVTASEKGSGRAAKAAAEAAGKMSEEQKAAAREVESEWDGMASSLESNTRSMIESGKLQWESFGDFFRSFTANLVSNWIAKWAEGLAQQAALNAASSVGGSGGFSWGSLLGSIFGGFRADGGPVTAGKAYVVGEQGPELVVPNSDGMVVPNHRMAMASGGGDRVVVNQYFSTGVSEAQLYGATQAVYDAALAGVADRVSRGGNYRRGIQG